MSVLQGAALALLCIASVQSHFMEDAEDLKSFLKILSKPRKLDRHKTHKHKSEHHVLGFKWNNCGSSTDMLQLTDLKVSPDPIPLPGNITASFSSKILANITAPLTVKLELEKKLFGVFVPIPCIDNIGSCTYDDICSLIPIQPGQLCPDPLPKYKLPCKCPFAKGAYSLPSATFNVNPGNIPSFLESGDYKAKATMTTGSTRVGCYEIELSIK